MVKATIENDSLNQCIHHDHVYILSKYASDIIPIHKGSKDKGEIKFGEKEPGLWKNLN